MKLELTQNVFAAGFRNTRNGDRPSVRAEERMVRVAGRRDTTNASEY